MMGGWMGGRKRACVGGREGERTVRGIRPWELTASNSPVVGLIVKNLPSAVASVHALKVASRTTPYPTHARERATTTLPPSLPSAKITPRGAISPTATTSPRHRENMKPSGTPPSHPPPFPWGREELRPHLPSPHTSIRSSLNALHSQRSSAEKSIKTMERQARRTTSLKPGGGGGEGGTGEGGGALFAVSQQGSL